MNTKPKIMISFKEDGKNGGPFVSHKRISESALKEKYEFIPLIIPKGRTGLLNIRLLVRLVKEIRSARPDIVHFDGLQLQGFHTAIACKLAGIRNTVLAVHGSSMEAVGLPPWKRSIINFLENITLRLSKICYGVSEYVTGWEKIRKYSRQCFGHIYNMPDPDIQNSSEHSIRDETGISKDDVVIVSTGRITLEKGYGTLFNVIMALRHLNSVKFIIAGDGDYLPELQNKVKANELQNRVFLLGYRNDINRILAGSDIFIICTMHETLCISIIEACFNSLPVVATEVGGIPEIIINGKNGYLFEVNDSEAATAALKTLINDPEKRKEMGKKGKEIIEKNFSEDRIIEKIDRLYIEVLKK